MMVDDKKKMNKKTADGNNLPPITNHSEYYKDNGSDVPTANIKEYRKMLNEEANKLEENIAKAKDNILFWQSYLLQLEDAKREQLQIIKDNKKIIEQNAI